MTVHQQPVIADVLHVAGMVAVWILVFGVLVVFGAPMPVAYIAGIVLGAFGMLYRFAVGFWRGEFRL